MGTSFFCTNLLKQYNPINAAIINKRIIPMIDKTITKVEVPLGSFSPSSKLPNKKTGVLLTLIVSPLDIFFSF